MVKAEWGTKRICMTCGARFYDMQRDPIVCPSCGATYDPDLTAKPRRSRPAPAAAPVKAAAVAAVIPSDEEVDVVEEAEDVDDLEADADLDADEAVDETDEEEDAEEADALIEDASELGEDDEMSDVIDTGLEDDDER